MKHSGITKKIWHVEPCLAMVSSGCPRPATTSSAMEGVVSAAFQECITPQTRAIAATIQSFWPERFGLRYEVRLRDLFPEPENDGLRHIWRYGRADLVVTRPKSAKIVSLIELHGEHHWTEKQARNDRRKYMLARENEVECLALYNSIVDRISRRQMRGLLGGVLFRNANR